MFLAEGFEEVEALAPLDLIRRAGLEIKTVGVGAKVITGSHGIPVTADMTDAEFSDNAPDMVILPGGMPGTKNLDASPLTDRLIEEVLENGGRLAAICAAPMILGKRGLLNGKCATCYPGFEEELSGATVISTYAVTDGNITTATGAGAAIPFADELVTLLCGESAKEELLRAIRYTDVLPQK